MAISENAVALNAVVGTTTSVAFDVSMRSNVSIAITCAGHTSGNGVFTVTASNDGTNYTGSVAFVDASSTTPTTYVTSKQLSANGTSIIYLPNVAFRYIKVTCTVTTDGSYTAVIQSNG